MVSVTSAMEWSVTVSGMSAVNVVGDGNGDARDGDVGSDVVGDGVGVGDVVDSVVGDGIRDVGDGVQRWRR